MIRRLSYAHPFLLALLVAATVATLAVLLVAWGQSALTHHQRVKDADCPAIGEVWSNAADECVDPLGGGVRA